MVLNHNVHHSSDGISLFCDKYCNCKSIYHRISWWDQKVFLSTSSYLLRTQKVLKWWINPLSSPPPNLHQKIYTSLNMSRCMERIHSIFAPGPTLQDRRPTLYDDMRQKVYSNSKSCENISEKEKKSYFSENVIHNKLMLFPARSSTSQQVAWK